MVKRKKPVIAIDGPAGAGKSTIAKIAAKKLGYIYIDTGAMYRALTVKTLKNGIDLSNEKEITALARKTRIEFKRADSKLKVMLDGKDVSKKIREEYVSRHVITVAGIPGVREVLRKMQRKMGRNGGVVMEGRDIGTCVFPDADYKFYLDATPMERAKRRYKELLLKGQKVRLNQIAGSIARRDHLDKTRGINPLKQAADAVHIDSTDMTLEDVANFIIGTIERID